MEEKILPFQILSRSSFFLVSVLEVSEQYFEDISSFESPSVEIDLENKKRPQFMRLDLVFTYSVKFY